jgi:hypothetical protein
VSIVATRAMQLLIGVLVAAQIFLLDLISLHPPVNLDAYHYAITVAGYTFSGGLASLATLIPVLLLRKYADWKKIVVVIAASMIFVWFLLFLLASVAV